jgi:hypothetical protein
MLFEPDRHELPCGAAWDPSQAREIIRSIVGLCHGTAGNGYAFLKLYQRTGDPLWLERARSFAMHAVVQRDRMRQQFGQARCSLWTGDPGLAVYLWHCLDGRAALPALDFLQ